ncbi:methyltransferase [Sulfolobus sp. A20]|nr:methyltransferase [Sulfolobus sp. A20]TRM74482.1 class I SAM-dependent methyltransferase [Sulfolobus sp. A20-N-F8]TRM75492.1 class I SAM-dependent methyltransferase [Sulfolobus sp. B5]TRM81114.1 class I SAM-dependent methyltransferase [Sulfolobus sp. D5]TRM86450.1 class I SAM-dependent methyltransferase [Sulfolobus sp. C3]TRM93613.1 class I SAM-dependent methyltransferase [Sulfolobus sp. A20-N-G8]TRM96868.1 class I SAM-dependent methyltransferase [Sulfolobus sp. B1]TRM98252.1 class I SAM-
MLPRLCNIFRKNLNNNKGLVRDMEDRKISPFLLSLPIRKIFDNVNEVLKYIKSGMTVLDHGCGPGFYTIPIARKVGDKGFVYAVDSDEKQIKVLQRKLERLNINNVKTIVSRDLSQIPSNTIDFLLSKDVLCCTVLHKELAEEIKRVLKPNGLAFITIRKGFGSDPRNITSKELFSLFPDSLIKRDGVFTALVLYMKRTD